MILMLLASGAMATDAGNITGRVTAGKGISVVWVEAVAGKTFPKPDKPLTMDQKSLLFQPHILVTMFSTTSSGRLSVGTKS